MSTVAQRHHYVFVGSTSAFSQRDCIMLCYATSAVCCCWCCCYFLFVQAALLYQLPYKRIKGFGCIREFMRDATRISFGRHSLITIIIRLYNCIIAPHDYNTWIIELGLLNLLLLAAPTWIIALSSVSVVALYLFIHVYWVWIEWG